MSDFCVVGCRLKWKRPASSVHRSGTPHGHKKETERPNLITYDNLLVTSSLAGHAMRGTERSKMLGAVVGKALGSLEHGTGVVDMLVILQ